MKSFQAALILVCILAAISCNDGHLITDKYYRDKVETDYKSRREIAINREAILFNVFSDIPDNRTKEALEFLFAYMPLSDLADYSGAFFLANAKMALRAWDESPWRKNIPPDIFLHYILPCRVNNENLDSFRIQYYDEIRERIKELDMVGAALEINHWCHEKVTYQPSDSRTSSPVKTILSARGRCGEESTFTVAALRTAGIPARQVYTPRWAHTDDNHAWVEVWINGEWSYLGACEPEPVLDRGWFTEPARRAMLVHTKEFGAASGNDNVIRKMKYFTELNNLSKYALTKHLFVKVVDELNNPVNEALVEYKLFNYAEFYTLASIRTGPDGMSSFETGMGDLLIWASKGDKFDFSKVSVSQTDTLVLMPRDKISDNESCLLDLKVPPVQDSFPPLPENLVVVNNKRLEEENKIRETYIASWMKKPEARKFAEEIKADTSKVIDVIARSMGNYQNIRQFLSSVEESEIQSSISLLGVLSDKDLRDVSQTVLYDHLRNTRNPLGLDSEGQMFLENVLNPRVANEMLTSYRGYFQNTFSSEFQAEALKNPEVITDYINRTIKIDDGENHYETPLTPKGVNEIKISDINSRKIFFVAVCRSLGIPARLTPGSNVPSYYFDSTWNDVYFHDENAPDGRKGFLKLVSRDKNPVPEYYTHFTIARFESGRYRSLSYDYGKKLTDFKSELELVPGNYMIVTGNRQANGDVLSSLEFFSISSGEHVTREIKLRETENELEDHGNLDLIAFHELPGIDSGPVNQSLPLLLAFIEPDKEPTKHFLNDLARVKHDVESWGGKVVMVVREGYDLDEGQLKGLPEKTTILKAVPGQVLESLWVSGTRPTLNNPVVIIASPDGKIRFLSAGYRIGTAEQILRIIK